MTRDTTRETPPDTSAAARPEDPTAVPPSDALVRWMNLYDQLVDARALVKAAEAEPGATVPDGLKAEVKRLQRVAAVALDIVADDQRRQRAMSECLRGRSVR